MKDKEAIRVERAHDVERAVTAVIPQLFLARDLSPQTIGSAGLIRCTGLLEAMLVLYDHQSLGIGALARVLFESWTYTLYALLGGEAAITTMLGEHFAQVNPWVRGRNQDLDAMTEGLPATRLSFRAVTEALHELMQSAGLPDAELPAIGYQKVYRIESGVSVHGGLTALIIPLVEEGRPGLQPKHEFDGPLAASQLAFSSYLLAYLAYCVTDMQGLDPSPFAWAYAEAGDEPEN